MSKKQELKDAKLQLEHFEIQLEKLESRIPAMKALIKELELEASVEAEGSASKEEE